MAVTEPLDRIREPQTEAHPNPLVHLTYDSSKEPLCGSALAQPLDIVGQNTYRRHKCKRCDIIATRHGYDTGVHA